MIVNRLENPCFEIAVFGRVSCGKSSFLNDISGMDALPVGVTPVTAVPTRLVCGETPRVEVSFAESGPSKVGLEDLWEYASEEEMRKPEARHPHSGRAAVSTPGGGNRLRRHAGRGRLGRFGRGEPAAYLPAAILGWCSLTRHPRSIEKTSRWRARVRRRAFPPWSCSARPTCSQQAIGCGWRNISATTSGASSVSTCPSMR